MTSSAESVVRPGGGPWVAKWAGGAGVPSVSRYDPTMLMLSGIFGLVDGFKVTGITYVGGGSKADCLDPLKYTNLNVLLSNGNLSTLQI
uniref:Uncharacterized protein n=1 Tax=Romanomermis culicivorax TaxID=13658 RepID=A0A915K7D1_ROMCU